MALTNNLTYGIMRSVDSSTISSSYQVSLYGLPVNPNTGIDVLDFSSFGSSRDMTYSVSYQA